MEGTGSTATGTGQESTGGSGGSGGDCGGVDFGGSAITHVKKKVHAVDKEEVQEDEPNPPSMVSSADTDVKRMREVDEEGEDEVEEPPPNPWWLEAVKHSDGEDQESLKAIVKLNQNRSKRARKG